MAISAGRQHDFNDAVSFIVNCSSQEEIDRYWDALLKNSGKPQACGWIIDKWGVRWQIVPTVLGQMITDPDKAKAKRVAEEMLKQVKFDVAKLEAAFQSLLNVTARLVRAWVAPQLLALPMARPIGLRSDSMAVRADEDDTPRLRLTIGLRKVDGVWKIAMNITRFRRAHRGISWPGSMGERYCRADQRQGPLGG